MYCINCGVKLAEGENTCPLCHMPVILPPGQSVTGKPLYPQQVYPQQIRKSRGFAIAMTVIGVLAALVTVLCDLSGGTIGWCGYAIGGMIVAYVGLVLPAWFQKPNPVIFTPCFFAAAITYLLYINLAVGGSWFLPFAFPVAGSVALIVTAMVTLLYYLNRGKLYVVGGGLIVLGGVFLLLESLLVVTFSEIPFIGWSVYPLIALVLLGGFLIFLAICPSVRRTMERKFFF